MHLLGNMVLSLSFFTAELDQLSVPRGGMQQTERTECDIVQGSNSTTSPYGPLVEAARPPSG